MWKAVSQALAEQFGEFYSIKQQFCLKKDNQSEIWRIDNGIQPVIVKVHQKSFRSMFRAQADQLDLLSKTQSISVPQVYAVGCAHNHSFLLLQAFDFTPINEVQSEDLAKQLAKLHQWKSQEQYGLDFDTWLGKVHQPNEWNLSWAKFFSEQRIGWQLQLCKEQGLHFGNIDEIVAAVAKKLAKHNPRPALLHGHFSFENMAWSAKDNQIICFDPACYWGDPECDLALFELTYKQADNFIQAYQQVNALEQGYQSRKSWYQLYYLLNFSQRLQGDYPQQAQQKINELLNN